MKEPSNLSKNKKTNPGGTATYKFQNTKDKLSSVS